MKVLQTEKCGNISSQESKKEEYNSCITYNKRSYVMWKGNKTHGCMISRHDDSNEAVSSLKGVVEKFPDCYWKLTLDAQIDIEYL